VPRRQPGHTGSRNGRSTNGVDDAPLDFHDNWGDEAEGTTVTESLERTQDLEDVRRRLNEDAADRDKLLTVLRKTGAELKADREAKSELIRSMVHARNIGS
jgi:hypothetical protein